MNTCTRCGFQAPTRDEFGAWLDAHLAASGITLASPVAQCSGPGPHTFGAAPSVGPWSWAWPNVHQGGGDLAVYATTEHGTRLIASVVRTNDGADEANARLIAAAPAMREALAALLTSHAPTRRGLRRATDSAGSARTAHKARAILAALEGA